MSLPNFKAEHAPGVSLPKDAPLINSVHRRLETYHKGKANAVKSPRIEKALGISGPKLRAIANYLASHDIEVVALGDGYFFAETPEELEIVISSLDSRANAIIRKRDGLARAKRRLEGLAA